MCINNVIAVVDVVVVTIVVNGVEEKRIESVINKKTGPRSQSVCSTTTVESLC